MDSSDEGSAGLVQWASKPASSLLRGRPAENGAGQKPVARPLTARRRPSAVASAPVPSGPQKCSPGRNPAAASVHLLAMAHLPHEPAGWAECRGMVTVKVVPCFSVEVTEMAPPWALATSLAMKRPRPMLVLGRSVRPSSWAS